MFAFKYLIQHYYKFVLLLFVYIYFHDIPVVPFLFFISAFLQCYLYSCLQYHPWFFLDTSVYISTVYLSLTTTVGALRFFFSLFEHSYQFNGAKILLGKTIVYEQPLMYLRVSLFLLSIAPQCTASLHCMTFLWKGSALKFLW